MTHGEIVAQAATSDECEQLGADGHGPIIGGRSGLWYYPDSTMETACWSVFQYTQGRVKARARCAAGGPRPRAYVNNALKVYLPQRAAR